jgi:prepilin-type processing-associated H-X9-DG protein/prepilin-type N-terminal cleavage/methylation domain-containing protein
MSTTHRRRAFTLVELLVVIGIIAALIGILLPVLSGVASRGRDIQCQSNLRTIVQLCMTYAAENKGQLPYGVYDGQWTGGGWPSFDSIPDDHRLVTLWAVLSRMSSKRYSGDDLYNNPDAPNNNGPFLRCPEAMQVLPHICSYCASNTAFVSPSYDVGHTGDQPLIDKPAKTTQLMPFAALVWDTNVQPGMAQDVGYVTAGDIDGQLIWISGASVPEHRFYLPNDPYGYYPPPPPSPASYSNSSPERMDVGGNKWYNIDPAPTGPDGFNTYPYQGQLRFRHNKQTTCNVGFADGHVGQFIGRFSKDSTGNPRPVTTTMPPRKHFMVKWPSGYGLKPTL